MVITYAKKLRLDITKFSSADLNDEAVLIKDWYKNHQFLYHYILDRSLDWKVYESYHVIPRANWCKLRCESSWRYDCMRAKKDLNNNWRHCTYGTNILFWAFSSINDLVSFTLTWE